MINNNDNVEPRESIPGHRSVHGDGLRSRNWLWTINNYTADDDKAIEDLSTKTRYSIVGVECGESGTPHYQGFSVFRNCVRRSYVSNVLHRAYVERARGTPWQNIEYCRKQGNYREYGELPQREGDQGRRERDRWDESFALAKLGRFEEINKDILIRCYRTFKEIRKDYMSKPDDADDLTGIWYCGAAGTGKSRQARLDYPNSYLKMCNKWWDGYQYEDTVIIDDFDTNHKVLGHHLKIWGDRYSFIAETKGGAVFIRPLKIVVTSQFTIDDIWDDIETREAIKRRFRVTHFN